MNNVGTLLMTYIKSFAGDQAYFGTTAKAFLPTRHRRRVRVCASSLWEISEWPPDR